MNTSDVLGSEKPQRKASCPLKVEAKECEGPAIFHCMSPRQHKSGLDRKVRERERMQLVRCSEESVGWPVYGLEIKCSSKSIKVWSLKQAVVQRRGLGEESGYCRL